MHTTTLICVLVSTFAVVTAAPIDTTSELSAPTWRRENHDAIAGGPADWRRDTPSAPSTSRENVDLIAGGPADWRRDPSTAPNAVDNFSDGAGPADWKRETDGFSDGPGPADWRRAALSTPGTPILERDSPSVNWKRESSLDAPDWKRDSSSVEAPDWKRDVSGVTNAPRWRPIED